MTIAGRKGLYEDWLTDDGLLRIEGWARDGLTDEQIARNIGVSERTFTRWKETLPAIVTALKKGKAPADIIVENSLYKSATGYYVTIKKPMKIKTKKQLAGKGTIEEERVEYYDEEIYIPPNPTSQIFWLKNRRPDKWRDKPETVENMDALTKLDEMLAEVKKVAFNS